MPCFPTYRNTLSQEAPRECNTMLLMRHWPSSFRARSFRGSTALRWYSRVLYHLNAVLPRNERALNELGQCRIKSIVLHSRGASCESVLRYVGKHGIIERVQCDYVYGDSSMAVVLACSRW